MINAAEGRRSIADDRQYTTLRRELGRRLLKIPELVNTHPTVDSFSAHTRGIKDKNERVEEVRRAFGSHLDQPKTDEPVSSSNWTGIVTPAQRLATIRNVLPLAQAAIEGMIVQLSRPGPNGGPLMDHHEKAIEHLRRLHGALGQFLEAAESGNLDDQLGEGAAAEVARYAKRAAKELKDDPMPYVAAGLLTGLLSLCGLPGIGGFLGGIAQNIRKNSEREDRSS